ncbi:MAG: hypothetical protein V7642_1257 [Burkholderiales bacterium]
MVLRADLTGARPVAAIEPARPASPVGDARQEAFDRLAQNSVGKQFRAEILSRLNDGSFILKLADTAVRMNLPNGAQVGDTLDLTLVAAQPRPTFLLAATPAGNADADTSLSNTGRLIDDLLRAAQKEGAPAALVGKTPVVASPSASSTQVASALKDTLTFSGLFYESHVEQWASGDRPLADLLREPQAQNSSPLLLAAAMRSNPTAAGTLPAAAPQDMAPDANNSPMALPGPAGPIPSAAGNAAPEDSAAAKFSAIAAVQPETNGAATGIDTNEPAMGTDTTARAETLNSESVRMISLQLDTLEQQRVVWQGELWPGQKMEWEITKDAPHSKVAIAERSWQSVVRFELPTLGAVAASIRLADGRLQVQVRAADENTASLLRANGDHLATALDAAGSPLDLLTVKRDESI